MLTSHGTYYEANGAKVEFDDAMTAWVPIAYDTLVQMAGTYNRTTTYKELTEAVQRRSGIRTRMLISNWSGKLLERVARRAAQAGEPPLTSLCVHQDGTIGQGYALAPKSVSSDSYADVEEMAAQHRLLCYRKYAGDLPADGGSPTLTPQVIEARQRHASTKEQRRPICRDHFMELPLNGVCAQCE